MFERIPAFAGMRCCCCSPRAQEKQPPYWASIAIGPGDDAHRAWPQLSRTSGSTSAATCRCAWSRNIDNWRLIQDPDGAQGWMLVTMLSDRRTAIVKPGDPRAIRTDR